MNDLQTSDVFKLFNDAIDRVTFDYNLTVGLVHICWIAVFYLLVKMYVEMVDGKTPFTLDMLRKPFFIAGMIIAFPYLENSVRTFGTMAFEHQISVNQKKLQGANEKVYEKALANRQEIKKQISIIKEKQAKKMKIWSKMVFYMSNADDDFMESVFDAFYKFLTGIDYFIYICFGIVAAIWLKIIGLGGAIAFTFSIISGGWSVFITWVKTYISVSLWVVIAGLVLTLVNSIGGEILDYFMKDYADIMIGKNITFQNYLESVKISSAMIISLIVISLCLVIVKLILITKVPAMLNAMIPGGGSAGGGLAAAFVPISVAKNVTQAAASGGVAAARGLKKQ